MEATRPYDMRWGAPEAVCEEFHINKAELKKIYLEGWVKARQVAWRDDQHRTQTIYCFEDIHRWLEEVAHKPTEKYVKKFWTAQEIADAAKEAKKSKKGPYAA